MSGNAVPQFVRQANISAIAVTAANTSSEGGGTVATDIFKAFTADATNGSFVESVLWMPTATANTTTTATVGRIFISSVTSGATAATNTFLVSEVTLPAVSADHATIPVNGIEVAINRHIPAGWTILVENNAAPAGSTQCVAVVFGGDY